MEIISSGSSGSSEAAALPSPKVGVGVFLIKEENKTILLGRRRSSIGDSTFSIPGGHLKRKLGGMCREREVKEETGLDIEIYRVLYNHQYRFHGCKIGESKPSHYFAVFMGAKLVDPNQSPSLANKCDGWDWYNWDDRPKPLFQP